MPRGVGYASVRSSRKTCFAFVSSPVAQALEILFILPSNSSNILPPFSRPNSSILLNFFCKSLKTMLSIVVLYSNNLHHIILLYSIGIKPFNLVGFYYYQTCQKRPRER